MKSQRPECTLLIIVDGNVETRSRLATDSVRNRHSDASGAGARAGLDGAHGKLHRRRRHRRRTLN
jgi:hypothetical protein